MQRRRPSTTWTPPILPPTPLAQRIRKLLEEHGTTARQVSIAAGLSPDGIRNILRGIARSPQIHTLQAIADALDVPLQRLISDAPLSEEEADKELMRGAVTLPGPGEPVPVTEIIFEGVRGQTWEIPFDFLAPHFPGMAMLDAGLYVIEDGTRILVDDSKDAKSKATGNFVVNNGAGYSLLSGRLLPGLKVVGLALGRWTWF